MAAFVARLDTINALADRSAGFIWRLQTESGDATAVRAYDDERILVNMSVWESLEALTAFVYASDHRPVMQRRRQWFERFDGPYMALWWVPEGHIPSHRAARGHRGHLRRLRTMTTEPLHPLSFEDYLALEETSETKHEYDDGVLTAMAGASDPHVTITTNLVAAIRPHLRGTPCRLYSTDMKLRPVPSRGYYPDVFVSCDERDRTERLVKGYPALVIEVLSEGTEGRDRGTKWRAYRRCETLREYVLIAQDQQSVEVYRREGDVWALRIYGPGEVVALTSINLELPVAVIYEDVDLPSGGAVASEA
jgi:Uma2 family endonuclease/heme-degrading monooxygenase HmoA